MRALACTALLAIGGLRAAAQTALPEAPLPHVLGPPRFALNAGVSEKYDVRRQTWSTSPQLGWDYQFLREHFRLGVTLSHTVQTGTTTLGGSFSMRLIAWGRP